MFPLDQAGWDKLALSGSQSAWLLFLFFSKLPPLETSRYSSALSVVLQPDKGDYADNLLVLSCTNKRRSFEQFMGFDLTKMFCASNSSNTDFTAGRTADGAKDTKNEGGKMVEQPMNEET